MTSLAIAAGFGRKLLSVLVCAAMVTACAGESPNQALTPEQQQLRAEKQRYNSTVVTGALAGAAVGAGAGLLASGGNNSLAALLIGTAIGAVAGAVAGTMVAERNLKFERRELSANDRIQSAQQTSTLLQSQAVKAEALAKKDQDRLDELDAQYRANAITAARYRSEASTIKKDAELIRESANDAKSARTKVVASGAQLPKLLDEEPKMGAAQRSLEQSADQLEEKLKRIPTT